MTRLRTCPLCGSDRSRCLHFESRPGAGADGWTIRECRGCGFVFLGELVECDQMADRYEWRRSETEEAARRRRAMPVASRISPLFRVVNRLFRFHHGPRLLRILLRHRTGGRLCDFGCGEGKLLKAARGQFAVAGIDISTPQIELARAAVPDARLIVGSVAAQHLPAEQFDVVTMQCYLEHDPEPLGALRAAFSTLRPGGLLAIKVPNYASWLRRLRGWRWCGFRYPDHCNYFTPDTLRAMVERVGFSPLADSLLDRMPTSDNMYLLAEKPNEPAAHPARVLPRRRVAASCDPSPASPPQPAV